MAFKMKEFASRVSIYLNLLKMIGKVLANSADPELSVMDFYFIMPFIFFI